MMAGAGTTGMTTGARAFAVLGAAGLALAGPVPAAFASSYSDYADVALEKTLRDTDTGVRAILRYMPEIMVGGQEEVVEDDGSVSTLLWDGWAGLFEVEFIAGPDLDRDVAEKFLREAVVVVCPSVDKSALAKAEVMSDGGFLSVFVQCPEVDATVSR